LKLLIRQDFVVPIRYPSSWTSLHTWLLPSVSALDLGNCETRSSGAQGVGKSGYVIQECCGKKPLLRELKGNLGPEYHDLARECMHTTSALRQAPRPFGQVGLPESEMIPTAVPNSLVERPMAAFRPRILHVCPMFRLASIRHPAMRQRWPADGRRDE
jgi:hypothetical protein